MLVELMRVKRIFSCEGRIRLGNDIYLEKWFLKPQEKYL